jgi:hypothetical protein
MSGRKHVRGKPSIVAPRSKAAAMSFIKATPAESVAASVMSLMMLAADPENPDRSDTGHRDAAAAQAAIAQLIAVRMGDDD